MNYNDNIPSSPESLIGPARPEYKLRSSSIAKLATKPAIDRSNNDSLNNVEYSETSKLPRLLNSDTYEVPNGTPHHAIPPLTRNSPKIRRGIISPLNFGFSNEKRQSQAAVLPPSKEEHETPKSVKVEVDNLPSLHSNAIHQIKEHQRSQTRERPVEWFPKTTTVKIDPPSSSSTWFNNTVETPKHKKYDSNIIPPQHKPSQPSSRKYIVPVSAPLASAPSPMRAPHHYIPPQYHHHQPPPPPQYTQTASYPHPPIDYSHYPSELKSEIRKGFYNKFLILQRSFPDWNVPLPNHDSPLESVHALYESYVKQISIHSSLTQYKIFLVIVFALIEFSASRFGVDLGGYAEHQIRGMGRYEGVLIELGEKYSQGGGGEWPVEVKICFIAITQAAVFFVAKYVEKWTGSNGISSMIHKAVDGFIDNMPFNAANEGPKVDAQGIPIVPGTEEAIAAVDEAVGNSNTNSFNPPPRKQSQAPTADIGSMLGGLFGGGNGVDMAGLVGSALKLVNGINTPTRSTPSAPTVPNVNPSKFAQSNTSPSSAKRSSPPKSKPRAAPVFTE